MKLRNVTLRDNLFHGKVDAFGKLYDLEKLDLSNNYFSGTLSIFGQNQHNLRVAHLNNDKFNGEIPSIIGQFIGLEELILSNNRLTGSIPIQIGRLRNISKLSVSYNNLKGTISTDFSKLNKLKILHLHNNKLEGSVNIFKCTLLSFISDCARTETSKSLVKCSECKECCNIDGDCITQGKAWPKSNLKSFSIPPPVFVILLTFSGLFVLLLFLQVLISFETNLPHLLHRIKTDFQCRSANYFYLSSEISAWLVASITTSVQLRLMVLFIEAGDNEYPRNLWIYSV